MGDRELLELAGKAAGMPVVKWNDGTEAYSGGVGFILTNKRVWNPLTDDGDALRLAVTLELDIAFMNGDTLVLSACMGGPDKMANTRRAIVRAAAEIGRSLAARR